MSFVPIPDGGTVVVFGATGTQGLVQVRMLLAAGLRPRAACRKIELLPQAARADAVACDFRNPEQIVAAVEGAHAVFITPPNFTGFDTVDLIRKVATASKAAGVRRICVNTQLPRSNPRPAAADKWEQELAAIGVPFASLRPGPWMENLQFPFVQNSLKQKGIFEYIHQPGKGKSWITAEDAANIMIECLKVEAACKPEGVILEVGGPQTETPEMICSYLSKELGQEVPYVEMTYGDFGEAIYDDVFKSPDGSKGNLTVPKEKIARMLEIQYKHWNEHPSEPMNIDMRPVLTLLPNVRLTKMEDWVKRQVWPQGPSKL